MAFSLDILLIRHWHHLLNNNVLESFNQPEFVMNDTVATDIYPLTVEEYETADVVSADVEVE